jgi:hypothetical protein
MSLTRASILRGPGKVKINTTELFSQGDISLTPKPVFAPVNFSHGGVLDEVLSDMFIELSFTPANYISSGILSALFPYGNPVIGSSLLTSADVTATVVGREASNNKVTLAAAAVQTMPTLHLSSRNPNLFSGACTLVASVKTGIARSVADSLYTIGTEAWTGLVTRANIKAGIYSGAWNSLTFGATEDGWTVEFACNWKPVTTDEDGTIDWTLESVTARATCTPVGQALALLDSINGVKQSLIGASQYAAHDLVIAATGGLTVTLKQASLKSGPCKWGASTLRHDQIGFEAMRCLTGTPTFEPDAIFSIAIT